MKETQRMQSICKTLEQTKIEIECAHSSIKTENDKLIEKHSKLRTDLEGIQEDLCSSNDRCNQQKIENEKLREELSLWKTNGMK